MKKYTVSFTAQYYKGQYCGALYILHAPSPEVAKEKGLKLFKKDRDMKKVRKSSLAYFASEYKA